MKHSTTHPPTSNTVPAGTTPSASSPAGTGPLVVHRWISRDGVRHSIACTHIEMEDCDHCSLSFAVDVLTAVIDEGLLCPGCCERLREELLAG